MINLLFALTVANTLILMLLYARFRKAPSGKATDWRAQEREVHPLRNESGQSAEFLPFPGRLAVLNFKKLMLVMLIVFMGLALTDSWLTGSSVLTSIRLSATLCGFTGALMTPFCK